MIGRAGNNPFISFPYISQSSKMMVLHLLLFILLPLVWLLVPTITLSHQTLFSFQIQWVPSQSSSASASDMLDISPFKPLVSMANFSLFFALFSPCYFIPIPH